MHWLHSDTSPETETIDILESEKKPLESRVFYNYVGQNGGPIYVGTSNKPIRVARVMDDGKTQMFEYAYNAKGMVTKVVTPSDLTATPPVPARTTTYQYVGNERTSERPISSDLAARGMTTFAESARRDRLHRNYQKDEDRVRCI